MSLLDKTNSGRHKLDETEDMDIDAEQQLVRAYAQQESEMKSGKTRIVKSMKKVIGEGKANFDFKTMGVLKSYICCLRIVRDREKLRKSPELR